MSPSEILLVDDDQDSCASLADILTDLGYSVDVAHDGPAALESFARNPCRLALLDYRMPGMDGLQLSSRLKVQLQAPEIVLVTGFRK
jgi:CheY-like chemotaxis protein